MKNRNYVQIGIDLGTTNSSVAVNIDGNIEVIKRPGGIEFVPSVFGYNKAKNKVVGQKAYESFYRDHSDQEIKNYKPEVKRLMGTSEKFKFERVGIEMSPEEISAEILKSLKEDILMKYPKMDTRGLVVTVPAAFSIIQSEATKRAGKIAGFEQVVLLQEPIAAAIAYGFSNKVNEKWLVYDLGGGTFDVALISSIDGLLSVLSHNGDNFLGGKNIDWDIVDTIIQPKILEKFKLTNFSRGNEKFRSLFSKLKYIAENVKIELSNFEKTTLVVENIGLDENGEEIFTSFDFTRAEFEQLIKPIVDKTIRLSLDTIKESGHEASSIGKIILVGGPTQIPYIRARLKDELGINVDTTIDPLTIVAKGACIFGASISLQVENDKDRDLSENEFQIILKHETMTSETDESVAGSIPALEKIEKDYFVQLQSDSGHFSSQKIKLRNGKFYETVSLEPNKTNHFWVYLFDESGNSLALVPDTFSITHGLTLSGPPLPYSVGVIVSKKDHVKNVELNVCEKIFDKSTVLPAKKILSDYKTARALKKNEDNNLDITIVHGESDIPDRNTFLCKVGINGRDLPHDLPAGTPLELTVEINESREVFLSAYIAIVDRAFEARESLEDEAISVSALKDDFESQSTRARTVMKNCSEFEKNELENSLQTARRSINSASIDEDEKRKANKEVRELKIRLDKIEKETQLTVLTTNFNDLAKDAEKVINEYADQKEKENYTKQLTGLKNEGERAIQSNDKTLLIHVNDELVKLHGRALHSNPNTWIYHLVQLKEYKGQMKDQKEADYYFSKGQKAVENQDALEVERCVRKLWELLPEKVVVDSADSRSGITR